MLCLDGVGEWAFDYLEGKSNRLTPPGNSISTLLVCYIPLLPIILASKSIPVVQAMGLAPYGEPKYVDVIFTHLIDLKKTERSG